MEKQEINKELRKLPSVEKVLEAAEIQPEIARYSRVEVTRSLQEVLKVVRDRGSTAADSRWRPLPASSQDI